MKTKINFIITILILTFYGCNKPLILEEEQVTEQTKAVANPKIIVVDGYTITLSENELIVKFDSDLTGEQKQTIRDKYFLISPPKRCHCGDEDIELWTIDTTILGIEEAVGSIKKKTDKVEGDRGFVMGLEDFPGFKPRKKTGNQSDVVRPTINSSINIAVIDTGLDFIRKPAYLYDTASLQECYGTPSGWNFVEGNNNVIDDQGHGTAVTTIITAQLAEQGVEYRILPLKVFNNRGEGSYWDVVCAFGYIREIQKNGGRLDIINTSFGGRMQDVKTQSVLAGIMSDISNKSLIIASAGNNGVNTDNNKQDHFLSSYTSTNLLAVGGFALVDQNGGNDPSNIILHEESNYGRVSIDLTAPFAPYGLSANNAYGLSGTSYSTAFVSSVAARIAFFDRPSGPNSLKVAVKESAIEVQNLNNKIAGQRAILRN